MPPAGTSIGQEVNAKVYALQTDDVRETLLPESPIELISISRSEDGKVAEFLELGDHELKTNFDTDDNWNSDGKTYNYADSLRIIVFDEDQSVSNEFYQYAITEGNLEALTNWTPASILSLDGSFTKLSSRMSATLNGNVITSGQILSSGDSIVITQAEKYYQAGYISITATQYFSWGEPDSYNIVGEDVKLIGKNTTTNNSATTITINYSE